MASGEETATLKNTGENPDSRRQAPPQAEEACRTVSPIIAKAMMGSFSSERVCVYIDGLNFYYGLRTVRSTYTDFKFDFARFIRACVGKRRLITAYYYNASLKEQVNPAVFAKQRRFFSRLRCIPQFRLVLCKRQRRTSEDGKEYFAIKGDDIHLAIDMLKDAYEDLYDTAILVSGDGDFAPLVRYVRDRGKRIENYHFAGNISQALVRACDETHVIDRKAANRLFCRGEIAPS